MDQAEATASDETKTEPIEDDELELISQQMLAAAEKAVDEDPIPETVEPSAEVVESKALEALRRFVLNWLVYKTSRNRRPQRAKLTRLK